MSSLRSCRFVRSLCSSSHHSSSGTISSSSSSRMSSRKPAAALLLMLLAVAAAAMPAGVAAEKDKDTRAAELAARAARAKDAVVTLSSADWQRLAAAPGRGYELAVMMNARYLKDSPKMQLGRLRAEFALAAQAFRRGPDAGRVFFVELVYEDSKEEFQRLGVQQLPYVFRWSPAVAAKPGRAVKISKADECAHRISTYPWPAEQLVSCIAATTGLSAGAVDRPSALKHPLFPLALLALIVVGGAAAWRLYNSRLVRVVGLWAFGTLLVYWFATGGGMYNIIRGMPMYYRDQSGKLVWWLEQQRGGQLGAEGFAMSSSYLAFSATLASLTYVAPRIRSATVRGGVSLALVLVAALTALRIMAAYQAKTGIRMRTFFSFF